MSGVSCFDQPRQFVLVFRGMYSMYVSTCMLLYARCDPAWGPLKVEFQGWTSLLLVNFSRRASNPFCHPANFEDLYVTLDIYLSGFAAARFRPILCFALACGQNEAVPARLAMKRSPEVITNETNPSPRRW